MDCGDSSSVGAPRGSSSSASLNSFHSAKSTFSSAPPRSARALDESASPTMGTVSELPEAVLSTPGGVTNSADTSSTILPATNQSTSSDIAHSTDTSSTTLRGTNPSTSCGITHSTGVSSISLPAAITPKTCDGILSSVASSTTARDAIPSTSSGVFNSSALPGTPSTSSASNDQGRAKAERCYVRCLRRLGDNRTGDRHLILETGKTYTIGRTDECQLCLPYFTVSRKHAEIKEEPDGRWTVTDNKSSNGTKVNEANWITPMKPFRLLDKDIIQFGPNATQDVPSVRYMFHKALKFSRHPSIPADAMVDVEGETCPTTLKRGLSETDQSANAKRLRPEAETASVDARDDEENEILGYRKQMVEMEERLRRQDEEMEEMKKSAEEEQGRKMAEAEALVREKMKEESEKSKAEIADNLRQQILQKQASHADEMEKVRREFERDKTALETELAETKAEQLGKILAEKEKELAENLAAAAAKLEAEKAAMEEKMKAELAAKREEEEKRVLEEMEERRRALAEDQEKLEREADEKKKALETELTNQRQKVEKEKENHQMEMKKAFDAELKQKETKMREELDRQKSKLEEEKKVVEERLQVEMNEKLEEKDKSLRDELIKERDRINNEIQMRQAKEAQLETEIASLHMAQEDAETESKRKILSSLEETMEDELKCSICTELLIEATNLNCSHSFCAYCIQEWKKTKNECPVCRTRITSEERVLALDSYIDKMVVHLSDDMKQRREENRKFREEQKQGMHRPQPSLKTTSTPEDASRITISSDDDDNDDDSLSEESNSDMDSNSSGTMSGDPDAPYGGYGSCYVCGHRGHWAPGCPRRHW